MVVVVAPVVDSRGMRRNSEAPKKSILFLLGREEPQCGPAAAGGWWSGSQKIRGDESRRASGVSRGRL